MIELSRETASVSAVKELSRQGVAMKEKSTKSKHRVNPVSGKDTSAVNMSGCENKDAQQLLKATMSVEEQQIAEIMSQSREDQAEDNTATRFRDGLNTLLKAFNIKVMDLKESSQIYEAMKDCNDNSELQVLGRALSQVGSERNSSEEEDLDSDSSSTSSLTGPKRRRTRDSRSTEAQKLPPIREENGAGPSSRHTDGHL